MKQNMPRLFGFALTLALIISFLPAQPAQAAGSGTGVISLTTLGSAYTQNFDTLANTGTTNTLAITGWYLDETGTGAANNGQYAAGTGSSQTGDTYSFGATASTERAFGGLISGSLTPTIGASFTNSTGSTITSLDIAYNGEEWRLGATGRLDRLDFQYSTDATSLTTGTWAPFSPLNFVTPDTAGSVGAKNGNATADRTAISASIPSLNILNGATFWIRWNDYNPSGSDDGLAVDDFSINPQSGASTNPSGTPASNPYSVPAGNNTLLTVAVVPGTIPTSSGLTVTCNLTAIGGLANQAFYDDGTNGDVTAADNKFSFFATIAVLTPGAKSAACSITDAEARTGSATITLTVTAVVIIPIGTVNGVISNTTDATRHNADKNGQTVTVKGVIYEKTLAATDWGGAFYAFFIQNTAATRDADANTSDGLYVFMSIKSSMPGASGSYTPTLGDEVVISGMVTEYYNMTELTNPTLIGSVVQSGVDLDAALPPVVANPPANLADANRYWERLQGMRVQVPVDSSVLGGRNVFSPADAEIWLVRSDYAAPDFPTIAGRTDPYERRAFRDANALDDNYSPTTWDGNGYRMLMGSLGIKGTAGDAQVLIDPARTFDTVTNSPAGGLNYTFNKYRIEITTQPTFSEGVDPAANNPPQSIVDRSTAYSIADYNLENLYDYRNNPFSGCDFTDDTGCPLVAPFLAAVDPPYDYVPASDAVYQARLNDISLQIINDLHSPDILMVQEVENQDICTVTSGALDCGATDNRDGKPDVLQELALKIAGNGGPAYDAAFDRDSSDLRGIAPAFLYRTDRVQLVSPVGDPLLGSNPAIIYAGAAVLANANVSNPKALNAVLPTGVDACETSWVFPRAPDIGLFRIYSTSIGVGSYRDVYVINNHFKSGPDSCVGHRTEQAKYNAAIVAFLQVANPTARIVVGGDLNVYPHPDNTSYGAIDQLAALYDPGLGLTNLWEVLLGEAPASAYSYVYLGMAQTLDQMFINGPMLADLNQFRIAHINSDFPADYPYDVARGTSDHDPNMAAFVINDPPTAIAATQTAIAAATQTAIAATQTAAAMRLTQTAAAIPIPAPVVLPGTGFAPQRVTVLSAQPAEKAYAALGDLWLEIPKLGVKMPIVGVPQTAGKWDVSWLGSDAGWLQGSAFPTWAGNSVLTGHVWNANNTAGPFRYINTLWWGDKVIVHAWGAQYVYQVRSVMQVGPGNTNAMLKHEELPWVTLITCRGFDQASNSYKYRVLVRAVLIEVK